MVSAGDEEEYEYDREYGLRFDCQKNGCTAPHIESGEVLPRRHRHQVEGVEKVNGHAVTPVVRVVIRSAWKDKT